MKSSLSGLARLFSGANRFPTVLPIAVLGLLTLAMFGDVLFFADGQVLSRAGLDLFSGEMFGLDFQLRELKNGRFPLWNPHLFSGAPFIPVAFYLPNVMFLVLPLAVAINASIALHVFLIGCFMFFWMRYRGLSPVAALLSSVLLMFSGPFFMHVYAGHLGNLWAMVWVPLIFLCVDGIIEDRKRKWILWGIVAVSMQIFTGQAQYVYYTAIAVFLYALLRILRAENRWQATLGLFLLAVGGFCLSAIQSLHLFQVGSEGVRSGGLSYSFAAMFSFPPENLLTLVAPLFFGDMSEVPYWGRCYLWEMCLFFSVSGLFLALLALFADASRFKRQSLVMLVALFVLALGAHTPLFQLLYDHLPVFNAFRGSSKFSFFFIVFMAALAGCGFDLLKRGDASPVKSAVILLGAGFILVTLASLLYATAGQTGVERIWSQILGFIAGTGESYLPPQAYGDPAFLDNSSALAATNLAIAGAILFGIASCLYISRYSKKFLVILILVACGEGFVFAHMFRPTFDVNLTQVSELSNFYRAHPGDYRVLSLFNPNTALSTQARDIWGYGPVVQKRYAEFIAFTQEMDPNQASTYVRFTKVHPLYTLLRLRYVLIPADGKILIRETNSHMPRTQLIRDVRILRERDLIFAEMGKAAFDPRQTVILETAPSIVISKRAADPEDKIRIIERSSDDLTVHAQVSAPAVLLVPDSYSRGWQVENLRKNVDLKYEIMPADYSLMGIPLGAGEHFFRIRYAPTGFAIGKWISLLTFFVFLGCLWHSRYLS